VSAAITALRAGTIALLEATGEREIAALVEQAELVIAAAGEPWSMGSRTVVGERFALIADAPVYAALAGAPGKLEAVRRALAQAVRTPETELADLHLLLRLPAIGVPWSHVYREAEAADRSRDRPSPEAVRAGAAALLDAEGDARAAALLRRADLTQAAIPEASPPLMRWVAHLHPADLAAAERDGRLADSLRRALRAAATRAEEAVTVELALLVDDPGSRG
jgi:hypothetical protein